MTGYRKLPVRVVIADTGPLVSLAACGRLDLLGEFLQPVRIADIVQAECLRFPDKPGAGTLGYWFDSSKCPVEVVTTPFLPIWRDAVAAENADLAGGRQSLGIGDAVLAMTGCRPVRLIKASPRRAAVSG